MTDATAYRMAEAWLKGELRYYWPRRSRDPGARYQTRRLIRALKQLRDDGPWWEATA